MKKIFIQDENGYLIEKPKSDFLIECIPVEPLYIDYTTGLRYVTSEAYKTALVQEYPLGTGGKNTSGTEIQNHISHKEREI